MPRTQGNYNADTAHNGGWTFYSANELVDMSASTLAVLTRNALGDYSLNRTAGGAETHTFTVGLNGMARRLQLYPDINNTPFQEQFGKGNLTAGYPAGASGIPPFTGLSQLTPATNSPAKGIRVTDVVMVYQVGVADLTSATPSLNSISYANNVANLITNVPIAATALPLTAAGDAAGPYQVTRAVTTPSFLVTDLSDLLLEIAFVMQNNGTLRVYGLGFHFDFNLA